MHRNDLWHLPGEGEDADEEEDHEKAELLAGLGQGGEEALQTVEVSHQLPWNNSLNKAEMSLWIAFATTNTMFSPECDGRVRR